MPKFVYMCKILAARYISAGYLLRSRPCIKVLGHIIVQFSPVGGGITVKHNSSGTVCVLIFTLTNLIKK